jgi:hypothetical protein
MEYYALNIGSYLPKFRNNLPFTSSSCHETSQTTNLRCVKSQMSDDLFFTAKKV